MKVFEYTDDSWWDDNGCDCCPGQIMPVYNLLNSEHEYYVYSCHTEEDCYRQALELEGIIDPEMDFDYNEVDFELMCQTYGIKVIIHYDEEFEED